MFIDTSVTNAQSILGDIPAGASVVKIDAGQDGVAQISTYLASHTGIGAVHIISHGDSGMLEIGSSVLTDTTLSQYSSQIQGWSASLAPGANILLYGCDVADGAAGHSLVQSIASLTGAAVAASTHLVGDAALGGTSTLDYDVGQVTTAAIDTSKLDDVLSHFRASNLTWNVTTGRTVEFSMQTSFRTSFFGSPTLGSIVSVGTSFNFGDGTSTPIYLKVLSLNTTSDYFVGQFVTVAGGPVAHTYAADQNYTAYWESSARLSTTQNFANQGWESQTIVDIGHGTQSPISSLAPIIQIADNSVATFQIPAVDANGDTLVYKLGTANQFISSGSSSATVVDPAGLTVDSKTGLVTWDIRSSVQPSVAVGQLWVATVMVEAHDKVSGALKSETPLDFLLQVVDTSSTKPPVFTVVPPATIVNVGQMQEVVLVASDPAGALTNISVLNPPLGLTTVFHADDSELHVDFTPTAAEAGSSYVVTFQAVDAQGLTANTSVTFTVPLLNPVVMLDVSPTASNITTATLGTVIAGVSTDPLSVTLTSDADYATGSKVELLGNQLFYTPGLVTTAQASTPDVISYTVKDTISGAITSETQSVTLSNGPAPTIVAMSAPVVQNAATTILGTATTGLGNDGLSVSLNSDSTFATGSSIKLVGSDIVYTPGLITTANMTTAISGGDLVKYTVTDTVTGAATAGVETVTLSNGPAPIVKLAASPAADNATTASLGVATAGIKGDAISVALVSDSTFATGSHISLNAGTLTYTPGIVTAALAGLDVIHYNVTDTVTGAVTAETQTVTLGDGPAPVVTLANAPAAENGGIALLGTVTPGFGNAVLSGFQTADNGLFAYISTDNSTRGTLVAQTNNWTQTASFSNAVLTPGVTNYLHIEMIDYGGVGGLIGTYTLTGGATFANGLQTLSTNTTDWKSIVESSTSGAYAQQPWLTPTNTPDTEGLNGVGPWGLRTNILSTAPWINDPATNGGASSGQGGALNGGYYTVDFSVAMNITYAGNGPDPLAVAFVSDSKGIGGSVSLSTGILTGQNINFTPGLVTAAKAGADLVTYKVIDTVTGAVTTETQSVMLSDGPAPTIVGATAAAVQNGGTSVIGTATAGFGADRLSVVLNSDTDFAAGASSVSLNGNTIVYTPGLITLAKVGGDVIRYTVTDTVTGAATQGAETVTLSNGPVPLVVTTPGASVQNGGTGILATVAAFNNDPTIARLISDTNIASGSSVSIVSGKVVYAPGLIDTARSGSDTLTFKVTDTVTGATVTTADRVLLVGPAANIVNLDGWNNVVQGPAVATMQSGVNGAPITGPLYGNGAISGPADNVTITALGWNNTIVAGGGIDTINAGQGNANVTVSDVNGDNTVTGAAGNTSVTLGNGNNTINLSGFSDVIKLGTGHNTITGPQGNSTVTLAGGTANVTVGGWSDAFTLGDGAFAVGGMQGGAAFDLTAAFSTTDSLDLVGTAGDTFTNVGGFLTITEPGNTVYATIDATATGKGLQYTPDANGGMVVTLVANPTITGNTGTGGGQPSTITETQGNANLQIGNGARTVTLAGWSNVLNGGTGAHVVSGSQGNSDVTLLGDNQVTMGGYNNVIVLGTGTNSVQAGDGNETVTVGGGTSVLQAGGFNNAFHVTASGQSTITAGSGNETVSLAGGNDVVHLAGWSNLVIGVGGSTKVDGGMGNTYEVDVVGTHGGFTVTDFGRSNNDVLDLSKVLGIWDHTQSGLASLVSVSVSASGNDTTVSVFSGGSFHEVALLQGAGAASLIDLQNHGALKLG